MYDEIKQNLNSNALFPEVTMPKSLRKSIKELFENFHDTYTGEEFDWGDPVGEEIW